METVSVVLNSYRRTRWFNEQYEAVKNQSVPIREIFVWKNRAEILDEPLDRSQKDEVIFVECNQNLGVWARFSLALNCRSDYIAVFDDDTIPGFRWIENCLDTYKNYPGLLGTVGVVFYDKYYHKVKRFGWCSPNNNVQKVDIVGHCWFFHRDLLSVFWRDLPLKNQIPIVGEDIHFAKMIQKYTSYGVYVPPHPEQDINLWGSIKGEEYGSSKEGISTNLFNINNQTVLHGMQLMSIEISNAIDGGFKLMRS